MEILRSVLVVVRPKLVAFTYTAESCFGHNLNNAYTHKHRWVMGHLGGQICGRRREICAHTLCRHVYDFHGILNQGFRHLSQTSTFIIQILFLAPTLFSQRIKNTVWLPCLAKVLSSRTQTRQTIFCTISHRRIIPPRMQIGRNR